MIIFKPTADFPGVQGREIVTLDKRTLWINGPMPVLKKSGPSKTKWSALHCGTVRIMTKMKAKFVISGFELGGLTVQKSKTASLKQSLEPPGETVCCIIRKHNTRKVLNYERPATTVSRTEFLQLQR